MTWLIVFIAMLLFVALMAIGVMAGRKPIGGSCGGLANVGLDNTCHCGRTPGSCGSDADAPQAIAPGGDAAPRA